ncbi:hypothetical protein RI367_006494 [Sorochytrium milnesiophthora]
MSQPFASIFEALDMPPAPTPVPPPMQPRSVFTADDLFQSIPPDSSGRSPAFSEPPTDDIELALLQEDEFQALANEEPEQFQDLVDFAKKPQWLQMVYVWRRQQQTQHRLQIVQDALVSLPRAVGVRAGEILYQLPSVVQKCYVSYTAWQLLNLSWEAIFTMQAGPIVRELYRNSDSKGAVLAFARAMRKNLRDWLKRKVFSWEDDRVPKAALSFRHERWIRYVTPTANLTNADELIYACVLRKAALTGERACARNLFWRRVEQWCGQLRDRRTQKQGLLFDQGVRALVAEDSARATRMEPPHPTAPDVTAIPWSA